MRWIHHEAVIRAGAHRRLVEFGVAAVRHLSENVFMDFMDWKETTSWSGPPRFDVNKSAVLCGAFAQHKTIRDYSNQREKQFVSFNIESELNQKTQLNPKMVFDQKGTSNFWGHIYIDLDSRKLIKGDLYEYVVVEVKSSILSDSLVFERRYVEILKIEGNSE